MSDLTALIERILAIEGRKDSIEVGTPSSNGKLKVYFDASDLDEAKGLADNAVELLSHTNIRRAELDSES